MVHDKGGGNEFRRIFGRTLNIIGEEFRKTFLGDRQVRKEFIRILFQNTGSGSNDLSAVGKELFQPFFQGGIHPQIIGKDQHLEGVDITFHIQPVKGNVALQQKA